MKNLKRMIRKYMVELGAVSFYIILAVIAFIEGCFFLDESFTMGYALLYFYCIIPTGALVCSAVIGSLNNRIKFFIPLLFGVIGYLLPWLVSISTDVIFFFIDFFAALAGLAIGVLAVKLKNKLDRKNTLD